MKLKVSLFPDNTFYPGTEIGDFIFYELPANSNIDMVRKTNYSYSTTSIKLYIQNIEYDKHFFLIDSILYDCNSYEIKIKLLPQSIDEKDYKKLYAKGKFEVDDKSKLIHADIVTNNAQINILLPFTPQNSLIFFDVGREELYQCENTILRSDGSIKIFCNVITKKESYLNNNF
jgi:hypothetical protein